MPTIGRVGRAILPRDFFYKRFDMNTKMSKLALAIGALVMAGGAMAQATETATASAKATVITPLTIVKDSDADLKFGTVSQNNGAAGTVVVLPAGGRSATGGARLSAAGPGAAAAFTVTGETTSAYTITLPTSDVTLTGSASGTMTANTFTVAQGAAGTVVGNVGTLVGGTGNLNVGATLTMGASQPSGDYTGSFAVTVAYN